MKILGNSIVKHVRGYGLSYSLENCIVHVKNCEDYVKPSPRQHLYHIIIHVGTNETSTNKKLEQIAKLVAELALSVKNNSCDMALSDMIVRNDVHQQKVVETNRHLKEL